MDYTEIFRPIFSFASHASLAFSVWGTEGFHPQKALADLERIIEKAVSRKKPADEHFELAWYGVASWLDEKLLPLREAVPSAAPLTVRERFFAEEQEDGAFFEKLNLLLYAQEDDPHDMERLSVIEVYSHCLELGFVGRYRRAGDDAQIAVYTQRCRNALETSGSASGPDQLFIPHEPAKDEGAGAPRKTAMLHFWAAPLAVTSLLYAVYRIMLTNLYDMIAG